MENVTDPNAPTSNPPILDPATADTINGIFGFGISMMICSGSSCFLTGVSGCLHQRDPAGGMYGGSGGTDCAIAEATSPSKGASSTGNIVDCAEADAPSPSKGADRTGKIVDRAVADALSPPKLEANTGKIVDCADADALTPPRDDDNTGKIVDCADADALIPPSDEDAEASFVIVAEALALSPPSDEAPVAFNGNGEPSKPTVASFSWDVFSVNLLNAIGELTCES